MKRLSEHRAALAGQLVLDLFDISVVGISKLAAGMTAIIVAW